MLSSKTLLKNGRYRLDHLISAGPTAHLYKAFDSLENQPIVILKNEINDLSSADLGIDGRSFVHLHHDGLVRIADHFQEGGSSYAATEPLAGNASPNPRSADKIFQRLGVILLAIGTLRTEFPSIVGMELSPQTFFATADNKLKLLSTYPAQVVRPPNPLNSPYLPLEKIWEEMDHINQKAIYRSYDESSLSVLESPADERSDLYSLGAVFYRLLTGVEPLSAFERSIEMLDTRVDPLTPPHKVNSQISAENSAFVMRLLEIRRERRFGSTDDAIFSLPSAAKTEPQVPDYPVVDDLDLLEIPALLKTPAAAPVTVPVAARVAAPVAVKDPIVEKEPVESPVEKKPLLMEMVAETAPNITPEPVKVETAIATEIASSGPDIFSGEAFAITDDVSVVREKKPLKVAAMFAVAAVLLAAGGWGIFTFSTSSTSAVQSPAAALVEPTQTIDVQPPVNTEPEPQPITASDIQPSPSAETPVKPGPMDTGTPQLKPRPQIAETKPAKPTEKKPNEEKPKKKLTVDDLIN